MSIFHQGYALKTFLQTQPKSGLKASYLAEVLGVRPQAMVALYGMENLDADYVDKLRKKGIEIPGITSPAAVVNVQLANEPAVAYGPNTDVLQVKLAAAEQRIKDLEELLRIKELLIQAANREIAAWGGYAGALEKNLGRDPHDLPPPTDG